MSKLLTFSHAINEALIQEMERDKDVFVYGLDVTDHKRIFGTTAKLLEKFGPKRCFMTPLSEDAMTGFGLGAATCGLRPVHIHTRVDFLLLTMNQLVNMLSNHRYISSGKLKVPIVIRAIIGRGWGQGAQHSKSLQSILAHIPGLKVVMPTTPVDAKGLLISAIRDDNPVIYLEHRWLHDIKGEVKKKSGIIPIGKSKLRRKGKNITIVAVSWMVIEVLKAAEVLEKENISVEVIDVRTIYPLDFKEIYSSVVKTGHLIVADYDWLYCGFSAEVAAQVGQHCFNFLKSPIARIGFAPTPCPTTRPLENKFYPNAINIIRIVEKILKLKPIDLEGEKFYSYENKFKSPF